MPYINEDYVLPKIREDIAIQVIEEDGQKLLMFTDPQGYVEQPVLVPLDLLPLFQIIDGTLSITQLKEMVFNEDDKEFDLSPIVDLWLYLDHVGYMDSPKFHELKEQIDSYKTATVRPSVCAGNSYPAEPDKLNKYLAEILASAKSDDIAPNAGAIVVPHIDFRIGIEAHRVYATGYQALQSTDADLFVILGTSHYGLSDIFMLSEKDFETPIGIANTDRAIIDDMKQEMPGNFMIDEMAHRQEHSIELQVVFLQHLFKDRDFTILPILTGSFYSYMQMKSNPVDDSRFNDFITKLHEIITKSGKKAVFIASADFAHVGRKFGDNFDAEPLLSQLNLEDFNLITKLARCSEDDFYGAILGVNDMRRICGLSPIYSLHKLFKPAKVSFLRYGQWNESETKSAVSFASLAYYK
jgi:MEMO1 family protein